VSPWFYAVAEREHDLQNPTSVGKIRLLGERLRLTSSSRVLDVASGRGGPALVLARDFGCRLTCVERSTAFAEAAVSRARDAGLEDLIDVVHADASDAAFEPAAYDAALCLGASFVWDGLAGTLEALRPAVRPGGHVVVGEPFWRAWPLPDAVDAEGYGTLAETVARFEETGLPVVTVIASSEDDWDRYESLHWRSCEEWLAEHPDDPDADEIRSQYLHWKDVYLSSQRQLLGWAIFVGWLRPPA
jgi:SAM-dependent methyltransferase